MKCKNCGYDIEKSWVVCPVCSTKLKTSPLFTVGIVVLSFILMSLILGLFMDNVVYTSKRGINNHIKKNYNKEVKDIKLVKNEKNEDEELGCDGATFYTIKGRGNTEYYLVTSKEDDLQFGVRYDTHKREYTDTYMDRLNLRSTAIELYDKTKNTFKDYIKSFTYVEDVDDSYSNPVIINSSKDLRDILSKFDEDEVAKYYGFNQNGLYLNINMNAHEFCSQEKENIENMYEYVKKNKRVYETDYPMSFYILTLDNFKINFDTLYELRIYDELGQERAMGDTLYEFIERGVDNEL